MDPPCHVWRGEDDHAVLQAEEVLHALQVDGVAGFGLDVEVGGDDGGGTGGGRRGQSHHYKYFQHLKARKDFFEDIL